MKTETLGMLRTLVPGCTCLDLEPAGEIVEAVAAVAANHSGEWVPGGEGLCLPVTAAVCHVLVEAGVPDVRAVYGAFCMDADMDAHWWVRVGDRIVDPTRAQFDFGPIISPVGSSEYQVEREVLPGWSYEHVVLESVRAFEFADAGRQFGEFLLELLRLTARSVGR
jgi:hypothetical protein